MNKAELLATISTLDTLIQIFAVLVAIGILGEVGFGVRHWVLSRRLAVIQHAEDLNQEQAIAKQSVDVRRSASVMMVNNRIVQVTPIGDDTTGLAGALIGVLKEVGWN